MRIILVAFVMMVIGCNPPAPDSRVTPRSASQERDTKNPTDTDAVDPRWREEVFYDCEPLENKPSVVVEAIDRIAIDDIYRTRAKITVNNTGKTTLSYSGYGPNHIRTFQEFYTNGRWAMHDWEWCGTGASEREILPNDSVSFEVWFRDDERRERVLGCFIEKGTNRSGLVILAAEPT